jgi:MFS superfamily sulfate permease-like transporter
LPIPAVPGVGLAEVAALLPGALGIMLVGYAESMALEQQMRKS